MRSRPAGLASTVPYAIEAPFSIWIGGRLIRGRIDAVYQRSSESRDAEFQVVDWKTGRAENADPLQLAIYRLAWAEAYGLPAKRNRRDLLSRTH